MNEEIPRLYSDLAWLWPLWEDVEAYRAEVEKLQTAAGADSRTLSVFTCLKPL